MRTRFTWIVAVLALISIGFGMACSTKYSSSSNGLVVVPSRDSQVMQTFSIDLSNGAASQINNVNGPPIAGLPSSVIIDPAGAYAYVATTVNCTPPNPPPNTSLTAVQGAILAYKINSDGKLSASNAAQYLIGNPAYPLNNPFPSCGLDDTANPNAGNPIAAMAMDSAGKFLFVAAAQASAIYTINTNTTTPTSTTATLNSPGIIVYAIGASASLTPVAGSPFAMPVRQAGQSPTPSALAVTPTVFPAQFAVCSGQAAPATENLYVADSIDNVVVNYSVSSAGVLAVVPTATTTAVPTGTVPSGVAVDPCNRFAYVANAQSNNVSAYTICSVVNLNLQPPCQSADYSLHEVTGSPYPVGEVPGPMAVDAYANFLYVVDTGSSQVSAFRMSSASGALTALSPATVSTNLGANSIAIRSDDSWLFVANSTSANVSQYAITPATGILTPQPSPISTLNLPSGVAVK
jgi:6-phosphogluconolactonase (cycloisomerase 2 family)